MATLVERISEDLGILLDEAFTHYNKFLEISIQERDLLINRDYQALQQIVISKEKIVTEIARLEEKKGQILYELSKLLGKDVSKYPLGRLLELLPEAHVKGLREKAERLSIVIQSLRGENERTLRFLYRSLHILGILFERIKETLLPRETYNVLSFKNHSTSLFLSTTA